MLGNTYVNFHVLIRVVNDDAIIYNLVGTHDAQYRLRYSCYIFFFEFQIITNENNNVYILHR